MLLAQMLWTVTVVIVTAYFIAELTAVVIFTAALTVIGANRLSSKALVVCGLDSIIVDSFSVFFKSEVDSLSWLTELVILIAWGLLLLVFTFCLGLR